MRSKPSHLQRWRNRLATSRIAATWQSFCYETNFPMAIRLFIACAAITYSWWRLDPQDLSNLWPEMGGMTLDVFFILNVFALFEHRRSKREDVARQREVIDHYKRWDYPEAHLRIARANRPPEPAWHFRARHGPGAANRFQLRTRGRSEPRRIEIL